MGQLIRFPGPVIRRLREILRGEPTAAPAGKLRVLGDERSRPRRRRRRP